MPYLALYRLAILIIMAALVLIIASPSQARIFAARFDDDIKSAVRTYWPGYPFWLAWKAQLYQESHLDPYAVSPVGARGIAQFMPGTWEQTAAAMLYPHAASPNNATLAIKAGAYYMARMRAIWLYDRPEADRHDLATASYNAGAGNIIKAQSACNDARHWSDIAPCLSQITGHHSRETLDYVDKIRHWHGLMMIDR